VEEEVAVAVVVVVEADLVVPKTTRWDSSAGKLRVLNDVLAEAV